jgi:hypothetical protein
MTFPSRDFNVSVTGKAYRNGVFQANVLNFLHAHEVRSGVRRHKPTAKFIPPTAYTFQRGAWQRPLGSIHYNFDNTWFTESVAHYLNEVGGIDSLADRIIANNGLSLAFSPTLRAAALASARTKLKNQSFNSGVAFGELGATAKLFESNLGKIAKGYRSFRKGNFKQVAKDLGVEFRKPSKTASNFLLEYSYGVQPLLSDIYGAAKALDESPADHWIVTVKGTRQIKRKGNWRYWNLPNPTQGNANNCDTFYDCFNACFVRLDMMPTNPGLIKLSQMGVTNPLDIAWNLTPFSFVFDWAWPLGEFLNGLDATLGWTCMGCSISDYVKYRHNAKGIANGRYDVNNWYSRYEYINLRRDVYSSVPFPVLLDMRGKLNARRIANGLALIRSVMGPK